MPASSPPHSKNTISLPLAIVITLAIVIFIREGAVLICQMLGYPSAGNIVGMITLFILLLLWRFLVGLPDWITTASNTLLVDSGFAFLPVSAGAGLLMFDLGSELTGITITIIISTLVPLWFLAKLSNAWLGNAKLGDPQGSNHDYNNSKDNPKAD